MYMAWFTIWLINTLLWFLLQENESDESEDENMMDDTLDQTCSENESTVVISKKAYEVSLLFNIKNSIFFVT